MVHTHGWALLGVGLTTYLMYSLWMMTSVWGGEVFRCPDGRGGFVLRDLPCSHTLPEAGEVTTPAHADLPTKAEPQKRPSSSKRVTTSADTAPGHGSASCLSTRSPNIRVQHADQLATELVWEVRVHNACAQPASGIVTFTVYGSRTLPIESDSTKIVMEARGAEVVHGMMRLSRANMLRMRRYEARIAP